MVDIELNEDGMGPSQSGFDGEGLPRAGRGSMSRWTWKRLVILMIVLVLGVICFFGTSWAFFKGRIERHTVADVISGYCATMAVGLSGHTMWKHLNAYTNPPQQNRIIRIVWMVPLYAVQSWIALRFRQWAIYLSIIRDSYESYVIWNFFQLLLSYMGSEERCRQELRAKKILHHPFPLCFLPPIHLEDHAGKFMRGCRMALFVYMGVKPTCAFVALILHWTGHYTEGALTHFKDGYPYITAIVTITVTIAFTMLFYFYLATKGALAQHEPTPKFAAVKAVVFVSFWQSVVVAFLVKIDVISATVEWTVDDVSIGLQDFLICIEMMFAAIAHTYVFSHKPYRRTGQTRQQFHPRLLMQTIIPNPIAEVVDEIRDYSARKYRTTSAD